MIGVLNVTGLGFALTLLLVDAVGGNPTILLLVSAVICIILGMGMPTSGVYVLLASLVAPSLVKAGVEPIAANMFILYFGMMSMITPPVALASFAAATISRAGALTTALASMRIGWAAFLLPFAFVETPALLLEGPLSGTLFAGVITALGIGAVTIGITGYWERKLGPSLRFGFVAVGALALPLGFLGLSPTVHAIAAAGAALLAAVLLARKPKPTQDSQVT